MTASTYVVRRGLKNQFVVVFVVVIVVGVVDQEHLYEISVISDAVVLGVDLGVD